MTSPILLAVPNVSEGRDAETIAADRRRVRGTGRGVRVLDVHSDADHHRSVFTLAGHPGALGGRAAARRARGGRADRRDGPRRGRRAAGAGQHPHVGALDVAPIVYLDPARPRRGVRAGARARRPHRRGAAGAGVPLRRAVGHRPGHREDPRAAASRRRRGARRAHGRRRGADGPRLRRRRGCTRRAGATLVAARPPLVAFNLQLAPPASVEDARRDRRAASARAASTGCRVCARIGRRARAAAIAQVSMNVERPLELPLAGVVDAVRAHAEVASAELVGLAPACRVRRFPADMPDPRLRSRSPLDRERTRLLSHGSDQAQAPDQAPGQRRRRGRVARAHRAQADARREERRRARARAREGEASSTSATARRPGRPRSSRR